MSALVIFSKSNEILPLQCHVYYKATSSLAMAERPRELGDFKGVGQVSRVHERYRQMTNRRQTDRRQTDL